MQVLMYKCVCVEDCEKISFYPTFVLYLKKLKFISLILSYRHQINKNIMKYQDLFSYFPAMYTYHNTYKYSCGLFKGGRNPLIYF